MQQKSVGTKTNKLGHPGHFHQSPAQLAQELKSTSVDWARDFTASPRCRQIHPVIRVRHTWPLYEMRPTLLQCLPGEMKLPGRSQHSAFVKVTVTSHMREVSHERPLCHRIKVNPSRRFPSERLKPDGSLDIGTPAEILL